MPTINRPPRKPRKPRLSKTEREKEKHRLYSSKEWQSLRLLKLQEHPMCQICGRVLANEVHHIQPFMQFDTEEERRQHCIYVDLKDLMSLCRDCHIEEHKRLRNNRKK